MAGASGALVCECGGAACLLQISGPFRSLPLRCLRPEVLLCVFPRARMVQELWAIVVKFFTSDGKFSFVKVGTQLVVLSALVLGLVAFVGNNKTVTLNVDGKVSSVQTFGGTVEQVVKAAKVDLQAADRVSPSLDANVENGSVINVNLAKAVKVEPGRRRKDRQHHGPGRGRPGDPARSGQRLRTFRAEGRPAGRRRLLRRHFDAEDREHRGRRQGRQDHHHSHHGRRGTQGRQGQAGANDRTSQPGNAHVVNNMVIKVSRVDTSKTADRHRRGPLQDADHRQRRPAQG